MGNFFHAHTQIVVIVFIHFKCDNYGKFLTNWECSSYDNRAGILISSHAADILDIVISKSLDPERNLAVAAGLLSSGFVKTNDGRWILIILYLCLCKQEREPKKRQALRGGLENVEIWIAATPPLPSNKDKARPGMVKWMSLKCELTKGHLPASQYKTEPKGLNKHASCTVFRTWCLCRKNHSQVSVTYCFFRL